MKTTSARVAVALALCFPLVTSCADAPDRQSNLTVAAPEGCAADVGPIEENPDFTPYEERLTHVPFIPRWDIERLAATGVFPETFDGAPPLLDGLPALATEGGGGHFAVAYGDQTPITSISEFYDAGGLLLEVTPGEQGADTDTSIARSLYDDSAGDGQIVLTEVGEYDAAVSWADPDEHGVREHHVLWTDDRGRDVNLSGVRDPERLVTIAREVVCAE